MAATIERRTNGVAAREGAADDFWVSFANPYKTRFYRGFRTLPTPAQVIEVINGEQPLATVERKADGDSSVTLVPES